MSESVDVAIITVLREEYLAVRRFLQNAPLWPGTPKIPNTHAWVLGNIPTSQSNGAYSIVLAMPTKAGQEYIQPAIQATTDTFNPRYVFLCGIAAGIHANGVKNGDVIVSELIWGYEYGKVSEGKYVPRPDNSYRADESLITLANALDYLPTLLPNQMELLKGRRPHVHIGIIASGNKIIDDVTYDLVKAVLDTHPRTIAIEMEAVGAIVCMRHAQSRGENRPFLMIRSASDIPDNPDREHGKAGTVERDAWKPLASMIAADATVQLIREGLPIGPRSQHAKGKPSSQLQRTVRKLDCEEKIIKAELTAKTFRRPDGGVACACPQDISGCWTTASWLEALLLPPVDPASLGLVDSFAEFLISKQNQDGGWPNVNDTTSYRPATGHAYCALSLYRRTIRPDQNDLLIRINAALDRAKDYIVSTLGRQEALSMADVFYLLRYSLLVESQSQPSHLILPLLRKISATRLSGGGWSADGSQNMCVTNTARALWLLLHFGVLEENDNVVKQAIKALQTAMGDNDGWRISIRRIPSLERAAGETIVHNNTNCDTLNLCRVLQKFPTSFIKVYQWLASSQSPDGSWTLTEPGSDSGRFVPAVTWPTSEFLFTLKSIHIFL